MVCTELLTLHQLERAAQLLKQGELVAFPTETVYGLGACIFHSEAILSIFRAKGRPSDNPLIAHISSLNQVTEIAREIPDEFYRLAHHFFPGPLTVVLRRHPHVPAIASAGLDTIAVRMPAHPVAQTLIQLVDEPLVAPSANLSGRPSSTLAKHVMEDLGGRIAAVVDGGGSQYGLESTVIGLVPEGPLLLRPGAIGKKQIEAVLKRPLRTPEHQGPVLSPGMKYRHYCPRTPIRVFETLSSLFHHLNSIASSQKTMLLINDPALLQTGADRIDCFPLVAKEFYALLRLADELCYQEILVYCDIRALKDAALMNRLTRAAAG